MLAMMQQMQAQMAQQQQFNQQLAQEMASMRLQQQTPGTSAPPSAQTGGTEAIALERLMQQLQADRQQMQQQMQADRAAADARVAELMAHMSGGGTASGGGAPVLGSGSQGGGHASMFPQSISKWAPDPFDSTDKAWPDWSEKFKAFVAPWYSGQVGER